VKDFNLRLKDNDVWLTPPELIHALGRFDLDPCAPVDRPWDMARRHFTVEDDGLAQPWEGRVWLNPPYGRETFKWMERMSEHRSGLALIFARTETQGFHEFIWNRADSLFFFKGRIAFHREDGTRGNVANAPSVLVSYSRLDSMVLKLAKLEGRLVKL